MRLSRFGSLVLAAAVVFLLASPLVQGVAHAQGIITGTITGTVTDSTGALLPGAKVSATRVSTGVTTSTVALKDGSFFFRYMPIGTYTVVIDAKGFATKTLKNVDVEGNRASSIGVQALSTGETQQVVEVTAAANILETTQSQVTTTFDKEQLTDLPVGSSGGFDELALLIPGVVNTHADTFSNTNGAGLSVNGQRGRSNNFELDGQSNNDNSVTGPQVFFSNDEALAEVQVITDNFSAAYGRNMGSIVNYITKSGTNSWHGSALYKYSGDFTSSHETGVSKGPQFGFCTPGENPATTGCLPTVVPRYTSNWWGATLGGPILKDKLFGFGSTYFNHFYEYGALTPSGQDVFPTTAGLTALASLFPNNNGMAILQQVSPYAVSAGNPRQLGAVTNYTVTNSATGVSTSVPFAQYGRQIPTHDTDQEDLGRLDWDPTSKDHMFLRYFYQYEPFVPAFVEAAGGSYLVTDVAQSVGADETHIFGPHWVDQLRYSFQQTTLAFNADGFTCSITAFGDCPSQISITNISPGTGEIGTLGFASNLPQGRIVKAGQVQDNATWNIGNHAITFGGEFDYTNSPNTFLPDSSGAFGYDTMNHFIGGDCASGTSFICTLSLAVGNPVIPFKEDDFALYFQDDWKLSESLTLNLGLRYEFFQQAINLLHRESVANQTGPNPNWSTSLPLSETTLPNIPDYYKNIEPRIGFAFNPAFDRNIVVRGGYAINADPAFYNINLNVATSAPLVNLATVNCAGTVACEPTGGATFNTVQKQDAPLVPTGGNPGIDNETLVANNFRNPRSQTYTLGVEYQLNGGNVLEVRYTGNHTSENFQSLNANADLAAVAANFPNVVNPNSLCSAADSTLPGGADIGHLHCGTTAVDEVANTAWSLYNAFEASLTTRNYHNITATFAYTFSKTMDNTSEIYSTAGGGNTSAFAQNPLNKNLGERAVSGNDFPNVASISFIYSLPTFHTGHDLLDRLVNGWQANTIWLYNSGQPYTDYEATTSSSPWANTPGSGALPATNPGDPRTYLSYSDPVFNGSFVGFDVARPILSNPKAPADSLGIYTDTTTAVNAAGVATYSAPELVDYASGNPITPAQVRFITNNQLAANIMGNPYPGSGRNILRGDTWNNVDFSVYKTTKITDRVNFRLQVDAYDVLNRSFYGTPGNFEGDYTNSTSNFNNYYFNAAASGSNIGTGTGVRNMTFEGRILF